LTIVSEAAILGRDEFSDTISLAYAVGLREDNQRLARHMTARGDAI